MSVLKEVSTKSLVNKLLPCGHEMEMDCDEDVNKVVCKKSMLVSFPCGHTLIVDCPQALSITQCTKLVDWVLCCGHQITIPCNENVLSVKCDAKVVETLKCGHVKEYICHEYSKVRITCDVLVEKTLPCLHKVEVPCGTDLSKIKCNVLTEPVFRCWHKQSQKFPCNLLREVICSVCFPKKVPIGYGRGMGWRPSFSQGYCKTEIPNTCNPKVVQDLKCKPPSMKFISHENPKSRITRNILVEKTLPCGHTANLPCRTDFSKIKCSVLMEPTFQCGHKQLEKIPCNRLKEVKCSICVAKILPIESGRGTGGRRNVSEDSNAVMTKTCGHKVNVRNISGIKVPDICTAPCGKMLPCGHQCKVRCHESFDSEHLQFKCLEKCRKACLHGHPCPGNHFCFDKCPIESKCYNEETKTPLLKCRNKFSGTV